MLYQRFIDLPSTQTTLAHSQSTFSQTMKYSFSAR